jgi:hypothetical protein
VDRIVHLLPLALLACTTRFPSGRFPADAEPGADAKPGADAGPGSDAESPDRVEGLDGAIIVDPGDGGVIPPPDATVVNPVYDSCPDFAHASLEVPILVDDVRGTIARAPEVTSFLIPFAREEAVFSLNSFTVYDEANARLPAQLESLSRWGAHPDDCSAPIRFAYAHVRKAPPPGTVASWRVRSEDGAAPETSPMTVSESPVEWIIDTGAAKFTVGRNPFRGLTKVELRDGAGFRTAVDTGASTFVLEHGGRQTTDGIAPWFTALERPGKQVASVAARGYYSTGGARDLAYTVRLHFTAGSAAVRIDHTYYYGEVAGWGADGATNTTVVDRAFMSLPLAEPASAVSIRGDQTVHNLGATAIRLEQEKRLPGDEAVRFVILNGATEVERGTFARQPFLAVTAPSFGVIGTVANLAFREPQGLRYDPAANAIEIDFTSSPLQVGGARGIYGIAAIDFGLVAFGASRADALLLHAERPLIGVPLPSYVNPTRTIGPYAEDETGPEAVLFPVLREIHDNTKQYLEEYRITGIQLWPDMPRSSCNIEFNCDTVRGLLHEGGDNNYWNWSKAGIDELFRTGDNDLLYAFSLGEARTYTEALAFRPYHDRLEDSSVAGLAACYGSSRGYSGDFIEGLNSRRDACPADYSYSKTLKLAYLATGDRRFVDYFEEAGVGAVNALGAPPANPEPYLELNMNRLSEQRLENLANGAEFARDTGTSQYLRQKLLDYAGFMLGRTLIDGHSCNTASTGSNDTRQLGYCASIPGWMAPVPVEWAVRTSRFLSHPALNAWVVRHGAQSAVNMTVLDATGLPDFTQTDSAVGWRTGYQCTADSSGVLDATCARYTMGENNAYYYGDGLMAFLNLFGVVLMADPSDPTRICQWLPAAFGAQVTGMNDYDTNARIWGKNSGQAFAFSPETAGAISMCP